MKNLVKLTNIIESILFVSGTQVAISDIAEKLEVSEKDVRLAIDELKNKYSGESGINLLVFNKKVQFASNSAYAEEVSSVLNPIKEKELSRSMLEVAAIIAYKQPVTRIDLEDIRGNSEYAVQKLLELGVIEPVGRKDAVGRPVMFGTTDNFLKRFQISSLDELPRYEELINKINLIHADDVNDDYLYKKDEYVEEVASSDVNDLRNNENVANESTKPVEEKQDDFYLPDISEEEIPDFLAGEELEKFDEKLGVLMSELKNDDLLIITADHGNAEQMWDAENNLPWTAHTTNPVNLVVVADNAPAVRDGGLGDIAPTMLKILGIAQPDEMTGVPLV